ncbi:MAG TPA: M23 family metallopeptidase [Phenylobacterium sp.]|nr:M23 family metallopeptidase [Phenylobacterium sp.]
MTKALARTNDFHLWTQRALVLLLAFGMALALWGLRAHARSLQNLEVGQKVAQMRQAVADLQPARPQPTLAQRLVWTGADVDGDGQPDFANPTGTAPRTWDGFGSGAYGASRDGGVRHHEGVDYVAEGGQAVKAPISGYVTRIGYAYGDDLSFRYVEITNPALRYQARVLYVSPEVAVGDTVRLGEAIGEAQTLQGRYPGITDHVHLEVARLGEGHIDATRVITAQLQAVPPRG